MTKDNVTGKNKDFYDLGKKIFDRLNPQGATNLKVVEQVEPKREWVALTDDEVDDIGCDFATLGGDIESKNWFAFYLAIEALLREKNG
jgi:hypothetical protein